MTVRKFLRKFFPSRIPPDETVKSILIVDDDEGLRDSLKDVLQEEGYDVYCAASRAEASKIAKVSFPWVAVVDLKLPDGDGTALLSDLKRIKPDCVCMLMTAYADVDSAVMAMEKGAFYYLRKPVKPADLVELVDLAFETIRLKKEKEVAEDALRSRNQELEEIIARLKKIID
jgi:DNA-binding NtrC family response regulator